jgi:hypothetical protein
MQGFWLSMEPGQTIMVRAIIEVAGKPKQYVDDSLKKVIDTIKEDDTFKLLHYKSFKSKPVENFFSCFAELDLEFTQTADLVDFCFDHMPASIEISEPEHLNLDAKRLSSLLNDFLARLHTVSMTHSNVQAENKLLRINTEALLKNMLRIILKDKPQDLQLIAKQIGLPAEHLEEYLDSLAAKGKLKKIQGLYSLDGAL